MLPTRPRTLLEKCEHPKSAQLTQRVVSGIFHRSDCLFNGSDVVRNVLHDSFQQGLQSHRAVVAVHRSPLPDLHILMFQNMEDVAPHRHDHSKFIVDVASFVEIKHAVIRGLVKNSRIVFRQYTLEAICVDNLCICQPADDVSN